MKIDYLRASTIGAYEDCPFRFFIEYVLGFTGATNFKAVLGSCSHHVLEILAKCRKTGHNKLKDKYTNPDYVTRIAYNRYKKLHPEFNWTEKEYKFCRQQVDNVLQSRFNPLTLNVIDTEKQFQIDVKRPGFGIKGEPGRYMRLRGTIDLVTELDKDTIELIDYKTGERKSWKTGEEKTWDEFFNDIQLRVYDVASKTIYSKYKNRILTIIYTRSGGPFSVSFDLNDAEKTLATLRRYFNTISSDDTPARLKDDPNRRYKEGFKCKYVCGLGDKFKDPADKGITKCDKYYKILRNNSIEEASKQLIQIKLADDLKKKVSPRNDYSDPRGKIFKGTIE